MENQELHSLLKWVRAATILLGMLIVLLLVGGFYAVKGFQEAQTSFREAQTSIKKQSGATLKQLQSEKTAIASHMLRQTEQTLSAFEGFDKRRQALRKVPTDLPSKFDFSIQLAQLLGDETHQMMLHLLKTQRDFTQELLSEERPSSQK
jgi:hypothetical protein